MNRNAEEIRSRLTVREVAERYGFPPDRSGNINCLFHAGDHQASLHIYPGGSGWHCFGCGAGGSVIDFVMLLFNEPFSAALERLNDDFCLGLELGRTMTHRQRRERRSAVMAAREWEKRLQDAEDRCGCLDCLYVVADAMLRNYQPSSPAEITPGFAWALREIGRIKYDLLSAEEERWKLERTPKGPGVGKRDLSDPGAL